MTTKHTITITLDIDPSEFEVPTDEAVSERLKSYFGFKLGELYSSGREWDEGIENVEFSANFENQIESQSE